MTAKARLQKAERMVEAKKKSGEKYIIHGDVDRFMTSNGAILSLAEFEKIKSDNVKVVRVGIDLDRI
jgi:hypothetical protein